MLKVVYTKRGQAVSDFEVECFVKNTFFCYDMTGVDVVNISSENVLMAFQLAILRGDFPCNDIEFYYEDIKLDFDMTSGIVAPDGFEGNIDIGVFNELSTECIKVAYKNFCSSI